MLRGKGATPISSARLRLHTLPLTLACEFTQPVLLCSREIASIWRPRRHVVRVRPPQSERLYQRTHPAARGGGPRANGCTRDGNGKYVVARPCWGAHIPLDCNVCLSHPSQQKQPLGTRRVNTCPLQVLAHLRASASCSRCAAAGRPEQWPCTQLQPGMATQSRVEANGRAKRKAHRGIAAAERKARNSTHAPRPPLNRPFSINPFRPVGK